MTRLKTETIRSTRRELLMLRVPVLAGTGLCSPLDVNAEINMESSAKTTAKTPWPQRRATIPRAWLDLLGDFPTEIPPLQVQLKAVAEEDRAYLLSRQRLEHRAIRTHS
jgi:hypothetical protein